MNRNFNFIFYFCWILFASANAQTPYTSRILLIPLDDRPPCLQFPVKMGWIGDVEIVTPPRALLGRFTQFGQSEAIIEWLETQPLNTFDAAILSMDMLAYGGLVASRVHETPVETAAKRLEIIPKLRQKAPNLKIYGSSVIMRLAPTGDVKNEAYREKLARWADFSPYPEHQEIVAQLEKEIPPAALQNYKQARKRNLDINQKAVEWARTSVFDYLILSQDDARPKGIHVRDRESLIESVKTLHLDAKVAIQPGADEVSMLLLARAMTDKWSYHPKIKAIYSSDSMSRQAMPFEDRPLAQTVRFHIRAAGAIEVSDEKQADILYYVYTSRFEKGRAETFAREIAQKKGQSVIIADVDPKGDLQGGDSVFTEALRLKGVFSTVYGYACWNTAGNTIGTALPHGLLYGVSKVVLKTKPPKIVQKRMADAQTWFLLNRLLDDYNYHSFVRPKALAMIKAKKWNPLRLDEEQTIFIKSFCLKELTTLFPKWVTPLKTSIHDFHFDLPWNRTFEGEIDFKITRK
jgi:Protein of unknown function (DUF4127)